MLHLYYHVSPRMAFVPFLQLLFVTEAGLPYESIGDAVLEADLTAFRTVFRNS